MKIDGYTWQARVLPAVCFMLPIFIEINVIISLVGIELAVSAVISNILLFVMLFLFASWVRHFGRKREKTLFKEWGGAPTVRFLRCSNDEYNAYKKIEIKKYLKKMFNNLSMPTDEEEKTNQDKADEKYEAYIINLRALTRNVKDFPLLQAENRNYGMWRNLYGVKLFALIVVVALILLNIALFLFVSSIMSLKTMIILSAVYLLIGSVWLVVVTKEKIKDTANCYAERLLETVTLLNENRGKK